MKKFAWMLSFALVIIAFQNCAAPKAPSTMDTLNATSSEKFSSEIPAGNFEVLVIWDPEHQQYLDVDLKTGTMTAYEEYGQVRGDRYCLTTAELTEVNSILGSSKICIPAFEYEDTKGRVCTMVYHFPYASLAANHKEYRLGEMTNGCDKPTDLCGDGAVLLKNFTTAVLRNLSTHVCN